MYVCSGIQKSKTTHKIGNFKLYLNLEMNRKKEEII